MTANNFLKYRKVKRFFSTFATRTSAFFAALLFFLSVILFLSSEVRSQIEALSIAGTDNATWNATQAEVDFLKLVVAIQSVQHSDYDGLAEVRKRFDVFYSRFNLLTSESVHVNNMNLSTVSEAVASVSAFLDWMLPLVDGPDEDLRQAIPFALLMTEDIKSDVRKFSLEAVKSNALIAAESRADIKETLVIIAALTALLLITQLVMLSILLHLYRFANLLVNTNSNIIITINSKWEITSCPDAWIDQMGYSRKHTIGCHLNEFLHPDDAKSNITRQGLLSPENTGERNFKKTLRFLTKTGEERIMEVKSFAGTKGNRFQNILALSDITEIMLSQEQLARLVDHDALTGLLSRRGMQRKFEEQERDGDAALFILDADHFKSVNDSYGHEAGDALLKSYAQTLTRLTADKGCAMRLGGEEFAIIRPWSGWEEAYAFGQTLRSALEETSVEIDGRLIHRTASIGFAKLMKDAAVAEVMKLADLMQREAKQTGRNKVVGGDAETVAKLAARGVFITNVQVQQGLERGEFLYYVQPIWNIETATIEGLEALIRWQKPDGTMIMPSQFIDVFYEVVRDPHYKAIKQKLRQSALADLKDFPSAYVSFNYKLEQLAYPGAAEDVHNDLRTVLDHPDRQLVIELSEAGITDRVSETMLLHELEALKGFGYLIALDDFGVESSNIKRLQDYPIDIVKLDKSLVNDIEKDSKRRSTLSALVIMLSNLKIKIVVEGVETLRQAKILNIHRVTVHQGYVHARPMPPKDVIESLNAIGADLTLSEHLTTEQLGYLMAKHRVPMKPAARADRSKTQTNTVNVDPQTKE